MVQISAEFVLEKAGVGLGAERIASVAMENGSTAILGQYLAPDGSVRNTRFEIGDPGFPRKVTVRRVFGDGTSENRDYEFKSIVTPVLTGTALDWMVLGPLLAGMRDGEAREFTTWRLEDEGLGDAGTMTVTRQPTEVIVGHFYFTGANRHDISIADSSGTRELSVWMGGGFYSGWPVKIIERPVIEEHLAIEYRRIL